MGGGEMNEEKILNFQHPTSNVERPKGRDVAVDHVRKAVVEVLPALEKEFAAKYEKMTDKELVCPLMSLVVPIHGYLSSKGRALLMEVVKRMAQRELEQKGAKDAKKG